MFDRFFLFFFFGHNFWWSTAMQILIGACYLKDISWRICTNQNLHSCRPSEVMPKEKKPKKICQTLDPKTDAGYFFFFFHRMTSVTKKTMMPLIYMFQTGLRPGWKVGICHYQWLQNLWHSRSPRKARLRSSCMILLLPKTIGYSSLSSSFRNARLLFLLKPAQA